MMQLASFAYLTSFTVLKPNSRRREYRRRTRSPLKLRSRVRAGNILSFNFKLGWPSFYTVIYGGTANCYRVLRSGDQCRPIKTTHAFIWRAPLP
eukprot:3798937-Pleurochrysis_carterae.AAC.1